MSADREEPGEGFLKRWSRVKTESREAASAPPPVAAPSAAPTGEEAPIPELPPLEKLTLDSDFSGFFHPKVDEDLRRRALRKLFSDPHFNVMDGLDVYIDDYSKTEPIPPAMLAGLRQAQRIFEWAAEKQEDAHAGSVEPAPSASTAPEASASPAALEHLQSDGISPTTGAALAQPNEDEQAVPPGTS
jgi:hypothetical protein